MDDKGILINSHIYVYADSFLLFTQLRSVHSAVGVNSVCEPQADIYLCLNGERGWLVFYFLPGAFPVCALSCGIFFERGYVLLSQIAFIA